MSRYDVPPYVSEAGSIPFIYIGGKYLLIGAQYSADAIAGRSFSSTVPYMTSGTNATSKGAEAAAGLLVASICDLTYGQPASVCSQVPPSLLAKTKS